MHPKNKIALEDRAIQAAESALARQQFVSAIDVLTGMGMLAPVHVAAWRKGRIDFLERVVQGNPHKISLALAAFRRWALEKGLQPRETRYVRETRGGTVELQFSESGDPEIETSYRTHCVSPLLSERKQQQLARKLDRAPQPVVFQVLRETECSECGAKLEPESLLFLEAEQALCLPCAGLDTLEFLPSGDAALTRRAAKHSPRTAVVVRFSRSRERYERQGILVDPAALEKAEQECELDADARALERARNAALRQEQDRQLAARMAEEIKRLYPGCPRTAAGRQLDERALALAVAAAVRHRHTPYDSLLASGLERPLAREQVADRVRAILTKWQTQP